MSFFRKGTVAKELALAIKLLIPSISEDNLFCSVEKIHFNFNFSD